jgi:hypothetical protein
MMCEYDRQASSYTHEATDEKQRTDLNDCLHNRNRRLGVREHGYRDGDQVETEQLAEESSTSLRKFPPKRINPLGFWI